MLAGSRDLYGHDSGIGFPMVYRCSPLFLLLFAPFALLPLAPSAAIWATLKLIVLFFVVRAVERKLRGDNRPQKWSADRWALVVLICLPYVVLELHSGNVQFFIFAAAAAGFCLLGSRPGWSAALFALGTSVKVIPAFFLPYLWMRGHRRVAIYFALLLAAFLLLPSLFYGFGENLRLLAAWLRDGIGYPTASQWGIGPDHSLRGVFTRYLSTVTYSPDPDYRNINFAEVAPGVLQIVWLAVAVSAYAGLLVLASYLREREPTAALRPVAALEYGLLFCSQLLLAPLTERTYFVALLFPALVLSHKLQMSENRFEQRRIWVIVGVAVFLLAAPPLVPGASNQRLLAVYSPSFWGTSLITLSFLLLLRACLRDPAPA